MVEFPNSAPGRCNKGASCTFAHGKKELRSPDGKKTSKNGSVCELGLSGCPWGDEVCGEVCGWLIVDTRKWGWVFLIPSPTGLFFFECRLIFMEHLEGKYM